MLNRMHWILIGTLIVLIALFGCDKKTTTGPAEEENGDEITILSVTPNSGLSAGILTAFAVAIEYVLASADSGEVQIGFNSDEVGRYAMITSAEILVERGTGNHTFNVNVIPVNWGAAGDFEVFVNLSEHPHTNPWTPLAWDDQVLTF